MSATMTLKHKMARRTDAAWNFFQHSLMIAGLLLAFGLVNLLVDGTQSSSILQSVFPGAPEAEDATETVALPQAQTTPVLSPRMMGALDYVTRRYRVSQEALVPVFEVAQLIGKERSIDPLLIVAIIGIESGFNPIAESTMGAQGLMQIIPRFHLDKVPGGAGEKALLDPAINIQVGAHVLDEAIRRRGGLVPGLQYYAGSSDPRGSYASKVLAEKQRLELAARRNTDA